jgi:hypothetical protein
VGTARYQQLLPGTWPPCSRAMVKPCLRRLWAIFWSDSGLRQLLEERVLLQLLAHDLLELEGGDSCRGWMAC